LAGGPPSDEKIFGDPALSIAPRKSGGKSLPSEKTKK
jgi:hypothetical protein